MASILTALLEGVRGRAALEIQQCGGFPADKDVLRVGLRDIHRLLRVRVQYVFIISQNQLY